MGGVSLILFGEEMLDSDLTPFPKYCRAYLILSLERVGRVVFKANGLKTAIKVVVIKYRPTKVSFLRFSQQKLYKERVIYYAALTLRYIDNSKHMGGNHG